MTKIKWLIKDAFSKKGICSRCYYRNLRNYEKGIYPRFGIWRPNAKIVLIFEVPGWPPKMPNERGWTEKEVIDNFKRMSKIWNENMLLCWSGARVFLDCIAERLYESKQIRERRIIEIYSRLAPLVYVTEYCKCPIDKKKIKNWNKVAKHCAQYLKDEFSMIKPELVIACGKNAYQYVFEKIYEQKSFSGVFGNNKNPKKTFFKISNGPFFMPVVHPSGQTRAYWGKESYHDYLRKRLNKLPLDLRECIRED